ncbi:MAG: signal peptidase I [Candidatus Methanoperedens sp.]|jgi:signal peptidase|nr:signal peptidase I [Candidatus Methanoperedens sp.]PKL53715.1 MAG: signal peptidase I [Candidatus Methanoperedenaceae archaeon HGW-Methanoperedenaceae-1]
MIIITAIVTVMVTAIISTVARYVAWQISVVGEPFYRFIIWHIMLFAMILAVFYDSRQGFKKSISILGYIAQHLNRTSHDDKVNATMHMYREHARKFHLRSVLMPIAMTLFIAYLLSAQLFFFAIVTSGSMEPTFKKGDLVFMQNVLLQPKAGDIIIFPEPSGKTVGSGTVTVTHRIAGVSGGKITTKGDANPIADSWSVDSSKLLGKAVTIDNKPVVIKDVGKYFLLDFRTTEYNAEFLAIAKTIQSLRAMGIMIFFICIVMYLAISIKEARPSRHYRHR